MNHDFGIDVVTEAASPGAVTVRVSGDFDAAQVAKFDRLTAGLPGDALAVAIDVGATTVIDSSALGALVRLEERCRDSGTEFATLIDRPFQRKLMHHTGLTAVLGVRDASP